MTFVSFQVEEEERESAYRELTTTRFSENKLAKRYYRIITLLACWVVGGGPRICSTKIFFLEQPYGQYDTRNNFILVFTL